MKEYTLKKALSLPHLSSFDRSTVITDLGLYEDVVIDTYDVSYCKSEVREGYFSEKFLSGSDANVWFAIRVNNEHFMLPCVECKREQAFKDVDLKYEPWRISEPLKDENKYPATVLSENPNMASCFPKNEQELAKERELCQEKCMYDVLSDPIVHKKYACVLDQKHVVSVSFMVEKLNLKKEIPTAVSAYQKRVDSEQNTGNDKLEMPDEVRQYYEDIKKVKGYVILRKIGQYPSMADMQFFESVKYRRVLKDHYKDYTMALGLVSSGVGCGAFIYLRRIFEILVDQLHKECIKKDNWNEEEYKNHDFNDRIKIIEKFGITIIPNELGDVRAKIYGVLSKGVHQSSDQECLEIFPYVKYALDLIMDEQLAQMDKAAKLKEMKKKFNAF